MNLITLLAHLCVISATPVDEPTAPIAAPVLDAPADEAPAVFAPEAQARLATHRQTPANVKLGATLFGIGYVPFTVVSLTASTLGFGAAAGYGGGGAGVALGVFTGFGVGLLTAIPVLGAVGSGVTLLALGAAPGFAIAAFASAGVQLVGLGILAYGLTHPAVENVAAVRVKGPSWAPVVTLRVAPGAPSAPAGATVAMQF